MTRNLKIWILTAYVLAMAMVMVGYVRYDPYQIDGDAVSYMDLASSILHGRWRELVNGLWNPGYPALLALGKLLTHVNRMWELPVFYRVNYCIFLASIACTWFFVSSLLRVRSIVKINNIEREWTFSGTSIFLFGYSTIFLSWLNEFSLGKIRVDGLFASLLLLSFGFMLRAAFTPHLKFYICLGFSLGMAYLVKSPGFVLSIFIYSCLAAYLLNHPEISYRRFKFAISVVVFIVMAGSYITALSMQKNRLDFGDSAHLNYAWYVSGTEPEHLLNNQPTRFGHATVKLKHSEIQLSSIPIVLYFPHFKHATYGPWFDPSYFNEGIYPRFNFWSQLRLTFQQTRHLILFAIIHSYIIALLLLCIASGIRMDKTNSSRWILSWSYAFLAFSIVMYLAVHFLDRYIAGQFWIASIATFGMFTTPRLNKCKGILEGAGAFLAIVVFLLGLQSIVEMRQAAILSGVRFGWQRTADFDTAYALKADGIVPGDAVACFRACNTGAYWARLAGIHVNSSIFDPSLMSDSDYGVKVWEALPDKQGALQALQSVGDKALVGYFENDGTIPDKGWHHLAGSYYFIPLEHRQQ